MVYSKCQYIFCDYIEKKIAKKGNNIYLKKRNIERKKMTDTANSSVLKKLKDFLIGRKSGEVTPAEAEKIQKAAYALMHAEIKKKYSPTYLSLIAGLDSEEKQLFEASVYYLVRIAANKPKYKQEIIEILKTKIANTKINPEYKEYIKQQMKFFL